MPDFRVKFWILRKLVFVPTTVAEGTRSSPLRELTETARGATEETLLSFSIRAASFMVRLDFRY